MDRRVRTDSRWRDYVAARNECVNIMRVEKQNYEKDIMVRCKSDPRLFYRHINGKMKKREGILSLKIDGKISDEVHEMAEVMNECFQKVFTEEDEFDWEDGELEENMLTETEVSQVEALKLLENLDIIRHLGQMEFQIGL